MTYNILNNINECISLSFPVKPFILLFRLLKKQTTSFCTPYSSLIYFELKISLLRHHHSNTRCILIFTYRKISEKFWMHQQTSSLLRKLQSYIDKHKPPINVSYSIPFWIFLSVFQITVIIHNFYVKPFSVINRKC